MYWRAVTAGAASPALCHRDRGQEDKRTDRAQEDRRTEGAQEDRRTEGAQEDMGGTRGHRGHKRTDGGIRGQMGVQEQWCWAN